MDLVVGDTDINWCDLIDVEWHCIILYLDLLVF